MTLAGLTEWVSDRATGMTAVFPTRASCYWARRELLLTDMTPMTCSLTVAPTQKSDWGAILIPEYFTVLELAIFVCFVFVWFWFWFFGWVLL